MKIHLDTSSFFKLYHQEEGTKEYQKIFLQNKITHIFLSEIAKIEFTSTIWKKIRTKEITTEQAIITLECFETDFEKYIFVTPDILILEQARNLTTKYGIKELRTLDSIQLSNCILLKNYVDLFYSAVKLLKTLLKKKICHRKYQPITLNLK